MSEIKEAVQKEIEELKTLRDELKVQAHLAKAEAKEAWERLESEWPHFEAKVEELEKVSHEALEHVSTGVRSLVSELKEGYRKIKEKV